MAKKETSLMAILSLRDKHISHAGGELSKTVLSCLSRVYAYGL